MLGQTNIGARLMAYPINHVYVTLEYDNVMWLYCDFLTSDIISCFDLDYATIFLSFHLGYCGVCWVDGYICRTKLNYFSMSAVKRTCVLRYAPPYAWSIYTIGINLAPDSI